MQSRIRCCCCACAIRLQSPAASCCASLVDCCYELRIAVRPMAWVAIIRRGIMLTRCGVPCDKCGMLLRLRRRQTRVEGSIIQTPWSAFSGNVQNNRRGIFVGPIYRIHSQQGGSQSLPVGSGYANPSVVNANNNYIIIAHLHRTLIKYIDVSYTVPDDQYNMHTYSLTILINRQSILVITAYPVVIIINYGKQQNTHFLGTIHI